MPSQIGAIILAAGESKRLGTPKQLLEFRGRTLIERAIDAAAQVCSPVVVALGAHSEKIRSLVPKTARVVQNDRWQEGMASSIQVGLAAIEAEVDAALVMLCDQPLVDANCLSRLVGNGESEIAAAEYGGTIGVPAIFGQQFFPDLHDLKGQEGAKKILLRYEASVRHVLLPECEFDIDTAEDFRRLESRE